LKILLWWGFAYSGIAHVKKWWFQLKPWFWIKWCPIPWYQSEMAEEIWLGFTIQNSFYEVFNWTYFFNLIISTSVCIQVL
jgi:hypothetical protein